MEVIHFDRTPVVNLNQPGSAPDENKNIDFKLVPVYQWFSENEFTDGIRID